jgi:hypothetical protein
MTRGGKDDNLVEHTRDPWNPADHFLSDLPKLLSFDPAAERKLTIPADRSQLEVPGRRVCEKGDLRPRGDARSLTSPRESAVGW